MITVRKEVICLTTQENQKNGRCCFFPKKNVFPHLILKIFTFQKFDRNYQGANARYAIGTGDHGNRHGARSSKTKTRHGNFHKNSRISCCDRKLGDTIRMCLAKCLNDKPVEISMNHWNRSTHAKKRGSFNQKVHVIKCCTLCTDFFDSEVF